jgi:hypothetical protein
MTPNGVRDYRVNKGRQPDGITEIRSHLTSLGQSTSYNGRRGCCKGKLIEPKGIIFDSTHEKVLIADKCE